MIISGSTSHLLTSMFLKLKQLNQAQSAKPSACHCCQLQQHSVHLFFFTVDFIIAMPILVPVNTYKHLGVVVGGGGGGGEGREDTSTPCMKP